jgi:hypothetical protein
MAQDSLWAECRSRRPDLDIEARTQLGEEDVAETLKAGILRIARMTFDWAAQEAGICRVQWDLEKRQDQLRLAIRILGSARVERFATPDPTCQAAQPDLAGVIHAQVLLSGGASDGPRDIPCGRAIEAIVQVVGVLPHVNGQQRLHSPGQRRLCIVGLHCLQPVGIHHEPNPAARAATSTRCGISRGTAECRAYPLEP